MNGIDSSSSGERSGSFRATSPLSRLRFRLCSTTTSEYGLVARSRPHVLVMPQQFPRHAGDLAGTFSIDYISSIRAYCDVTVLIPGTTETSGGVRRERSADGVDYITWTPRPSVARRQRAARLLSLYQLGRLQHLLADVDLIHVHGPVFHGVPGSRLASKLGVPIVVTVHTGPFEKLMRRRTLRWLTCRTLERADCVCPVSDDLRQQIIGAGIRPRRV